MSAVDTKREIEQALAEQNPLLEGLRDFNSLNLNPPAKQVIGQGIEDYVRRKDLMEKARDALGALIADGYPDVPVRVIAPDAYDDLQFNAGTITAALGKFQARLQAETLVIPVGAVEDQ